MEGFEILIPFSLTSKIDSSHQIRDLVTHRVTFTDIGVHEKVSQAGFCYRFKGSADIGETPVADAAQEESSNPKDPVFFLVCVLESKRVSFLLPWHSIFKLGPIFEDSDPSHVCRQVLVERHLVQTTRRLHDLHVQPRAVQDEAFPFPSKDELYDFFKFVSVR